MSQTPLNITLDKVNFQDSMSRETFCFHADILIDGKVEGRAENNGRGEAHRIYPHELQARLDAYGATLPPGEFGAQDAESIIGDLITDHIIGLDFKKEMRKRIMFTKPGQQGIFQTKPLTAAARDNYLAQPDIAQKLKAEKILNSIPFSEALAIFKAAATPQ